MINKSAVMAGRFVGRQAPYFEMEAVVLNKKIDKVSR